MERINPAMGLVVDEGLIFILKFTSANRIEATEFCDQAQDILYDEIGSTGHFRIAPAKRSDLHENFILLARSKHQDPEFMTRSENEIFVAFIVRENSPDTPLSEELSIIPEELEDFCHQTGLTVAQMDVRELYR
jgi:hypothetical protein